MPSKGGRQTELYAGERPILIGNAAHFLPFFGDISNFFLLVGCIVYLFLLVIYIYICLLIFVTHPPVLLGKMLLVVKLQPIQTCGLDRWLLCGRWDLWTYHRYITRKWMICP